MTNGSAFYQNEIVHTSDWSNTPDVRAGRRFLLLWLESSDQKQVGEQRVCWAYIACYSLSVMELKQNLEAGAETGLAGVLITCLLTTASSSCFLTTPRTPCQKVAIHLVAWSPIY